MYSKLASGFMKAYYYVHSMDSILIQTELKFFTQKTVTFVTTHTIKLALALLAVSMEKSEKKQNEIVEGHLITSLK